jgi:uncharacterized protein (DUF2267 family)
MPSKESQKSERQDIAGNVKIRKLKRNNQVVVFEKTLQKSKQWIRDIQNEIGFLKPIDAYHLLRAVLHALRDQLSIHEAAHLSAQLPLLLRGVFYECWNPPTTAHKVANKLEFFEAVVKHLGPAVELHVDLREGVAAVFKVLSDHVSEGEMADILQSLSPSLKEFLQKAQSGHSIN